MEPGTVEVAIDVWAPGFPDAPSGVLNADAPRPAPTVKYTIGLPEATARWSAPLGDRAGVSVARTRKGIRVAFTVNRGSDKVQGTVTIPEGAVVYRSAKAADGSTIVVRLRARAIVKA